jgi:hypothetical protein
MPIRKMKPPGILLFQLLFTFLLMLFIGFLSTVIDGDWRGFPPLRASGVVLATLFICLLLGLPIRLNRKINTWWTGHQLVSLIGVIGGVLLLLLSLHPYFQQVIVHYDIVRERTNPCILVTGWFLTAFFLLHWYPR